MIGQTLTFAMGLWLAVASGSLSPGPTVRAIELRSDVALDDPREIRELIAIEVGTPLTEAAMRRTLTNLYAGGVSSQVEVRTRPARDGVVAVVVIWGEPIAESVALTGKLGLPRTELRGAIGQRQGQPLVGSQVLKDFAALQDLYRRRGYFAASVRPRVSYLDADRLRGVVEYSVDSGQRARIGEVEVVGDLGPFDEAQLAGRLKVRRGGRYRSRRAVREEGDRLRRWLVRRGHRLARVDEPEQSYDEVNSAVDLSFEVEVGPRLTVEVVGANAKRLEKKGLLAFLDPDGYDEALLPKTERLLREHYQSQGHYRVAVRTRAEEANEDELRVTLEVEPGPVYELAEIRFVGNEQLSGDELAARMTTAPRSFLRLGTGRLVGSALEADLTNLRAYYALQGFPEAVVENPRVEEVGEELRVVVPIQEGPRRTVGELEFASFNGVIPEAAEERWAQLESDLAARGLLRDGGPFHPLLLEDTLQFVTGTYDTEGYADVRVKADPLWDEAGKTADLVIQVDEGEQVTADRIIVRGNDQTRSSLVRRGLKLRSGDPVSGTRLLEAQRQLYRLGVFSQVTVEQLEPEPGSDRRDVLVRVREGRSKRLSYGLGYDSDAGLRGLLGFSHSNLGGRAWTLRTDMRWSEREGRFRLSFDQPFAVPGSTPLTYTLFYSDEVSDASRFDIERWGGRVEATREFGLNNRASLIYDYRVVEPTPRDSVPLSPGDPDGLERQDSRIRISSLIPNLLLDRRDDPLDPTRGWSLFTQVQVAFPFLSTTEEFVKVYGEHSRLIPLGRLGTLAFGVRGGGIQPQSSRTLDPLIPEGLPSAQVSIAERFFAGGSTSHRAYKLDELGILGETVVDGRFVGGNGLLIANLDLRFPLAGAVDGVVFVDVGNVWADWREIEADELKTGVGLGVRYRSPLGPLRLEVGWKLDRDPDESPYVVSFAVGNPF